MNISLLILITIQLLIIPHFPAPISAHFFTNINSIPSSQIPNTTIWDNFNTLIGSSNGQKIPNLSKLKKYFQHFGYLNSSYSNFSDYFDDSLKSAVQTYQLNFNLKPTGKLDAQTLKHIVQPRCGGPDIINNTSTMLPKKHKNPYSSNPIVHTVAHYAFFPNMPRWPPNKRNLTYAFLPENQLSDEVKGVFSRAFERWTVVTPLTFAETASYGGADIRIGFYRGEHGDGEAFDGVLGTLAHAFSPPSGHFHLDGDENWVTGGDFSGSSEASAVDLETVAVHEIGHLLGLGHSSVEESIMYPTIVSATRKVELAEDDIAGIQVLYGSNPSVDGSGTSPDPLVERDTSGDTRVEHPLLAGRLAVAVGLLLVLS